jgi:hypothetical protein
MPQTCDPNGAWLDGTVCPGATTCTAGVCI